MLPINSGHAKDQGCSPVSSNCVVWQGPDLPCIDLCKGDTISDVVAKLALELCTLVDMFDLEEFDFSCLAIPVSDTPTDIGALIQILIERICALEGVSPVEDPENPGSTTCPDGCIVPIAECFHYINGVGDTVTTMPLTDYVTAIGNRICTILDDITILQNEVSTLQNQVNGTGGLVEETGRLEVDKADISSLQYQLSAKTTPGSPTKYITDATRDIENSLIRTQDAVGTPTELYQNMLKAGKISLEPKMFGTGNMNTISTWVDEPQVEAESLGNQWLSILDLREAVAYIQENLDTSGCSDLFLNFRATLNVGIGATTITIFTDGSTGFTGQWKECGNGTTPVTVTDALGNSTTFSTSLITLMDNPSGYAFDITSTSIDPTQDLVVTADSCFTNDTSGSTCEKVYPYSILATAICPATVLTVYATSVAYQFPSSAGYSYIINVYPAGGSTPVASQIVSTPGVIVANSIIGLDTDTDYELEVVVVDTGGGETPCAKQAFTTLPDNCTPPTGASAILVI